MIARGEARQLGVADGARLGFTEPRRQTPDGPRFNGRTLLLDDQPAFDLSFWCGTCSFLFERLAGANEKLSLDAVQDRLNEGLDELDSDVLRAFGALLPRGEYLPLLLEVRPRLVTPGDAGDYFAHEQLATWRVDPFWGLPNYPHTPYYRTFEATVPDGTYVAARRRDRWAPL